MSHTGRSLSARGTKIPVGAILVRNHASHVTVCAGSARWARSACLLRHRGHEVRDPRRRVADVEGADEDQQAEVRAFHIGDAPPRVSHFVAPVPQ